MKAHKSFEELIDLRYNRETALKHEKLYGDGYQGPSSASVFRELALSVGIVPGMRILDVGSGLGGDCFRLVREFGVSVVGLDASPHMSAISKERAEENGISGAVFFTGDVRDSDIIRPASFDIVWTRDMGAFLSISDKNLMWQRLYGTLREGGKVLITDYCKGPSTSAAFEIKMADWGQHIIDGATYKSVLESAGFHDVTILDRTPDLLDSMLVARQRMLEEKSTYLAEFGSASYENLLQRWNDKIDNVERGYLTWLAINSIK
jgi:phosphoethanolamine N-methyltransferase